MFYAVAASKDFPVFSIHDRSKKLSFLDMGYPKQGFF